MLVLAHRTCFPHAPENSLAGIRLAPQLEADGVEADVRRTLDGVPVLLHDPRLGRTTHGWGPLAMYPYALLRRVRLRGSDEQVPALARALEALPPGQVMAIDVKDPAAAARVIALVHRLRLTERVLLWSSHARALRRFAREAPEMEPALLAPDGYTPDPPGFLDKAHRLGARGVSLRLDLTSPALIAAAHERGLKVYAFDADEADLAERLAVGLDGVVTKRPREVKRALRAAGRAG